MFLYALTIFLSAFLLFQIQPRIAKMILPWFGGSAAVWITAMLFFQTALLGGYLYAHWSIQKLTPRTQATLHAALLGMSILLIPITPSLSWKPAGNEDPMDCNAQRRYSRISGFRQADQDVRGHRLLSRR